MVLSSWVILSLPAAAGSRRASLVLSRSVPRPLSGMPTMASSNCSLLHVVVGVVRACSRRSLSSWVWAMWSPWASLQMLLNV
eukprot:4991869-Pyramimonas_sp.AAC.1